MYIYKYIIHNTTSIAFQIYIAREKNSNSNSCNCPSLNRSLFSDQEVANLTCADQDQGPSPGCSISIQDPTPKFKHFSNRILTTNSPIDYEMLAGQDFLYTLTVVTVDQPQTDSPKTGSATVFVTVLPQNDNTPVFTSSSYYVQVNGEAIMADQI